MYVYKHIYLFSASLATFVADLSLDLSLSVYK